MSVLKKPKRRPFGTSAGNALLLKKRSGHKAADGHRERGRDPSPRGERKRPANAIESRHRGRSKGKEGKGASFRIHVDNDPRKASSKGLEKSGANAARRRDSKTPRTNNLSSVPGAYDLAKEFDSHRPRAKQPAKKAEAAGPRREHRPDPSPIKRPDPSAPKHARSKAKSSSTTAKRGGSAKRDNFVSASLKRLFTPKESEKSHAVAERRGEPSGASPPGRRDGSSDMDTASSTPEKDSPLVTSPLTKPDPIAKDVAEKVAPFDRNEKAGKGSTFAAGRSEGVTPSIPNLGRATAPPAAPKKDAFQNDQAKGVPQEVLDRARSGPMDNKRVLKAMFNSGSRRPPPPAEKVEAVDSLVGSIIGPATLQRSYSADESVLTIMDGVDDASQASMTTRAETARGGIAPHRNAPTQRSGAVSDIFRSKAPTTSTNTTTLHQEIRRANAINEVPSVQNTSIQLPAGWREKWSKSKQKPYYVHPDFGTTWHCPGLPSIASVSAGQSELYDDQRVPLGMSQQAFFSSYVAESAGGTHESRARAGWTADSSGQGPFHGDEYLAPKGTDASRMAQSTHGRGSSMNEEANDYASSMPKSTNASSTAYSAQGIGASVDGISTSNFNAHVKEASREEVAGGVNRGKDVSSTESFSKCHTQDFGSDDCVASTDGHVDKEEARDGNGEESRADEKNQNELHDQFSVHESDSVDYGGQGGGFGAVDDREVMEPEQTLDDASVDFNNDQGGGFDDLDDESRGQWGAQELDQSLGGVEEASVDSITNMKGEDEKQLDPPQSDAKETQGQASDVDGGSVLDTIADDGGDLNSLVSDHVDVDKLLRHGTKRGKSPLLSTIKEMSKESPNFSSHSSVVSPDEESDDAELAGLKVLDDSKDEPKKKKHSLERLNSVGVDNSPTDFGNADDQSPMFENDGGGAISDIDSSGSQADKSFEGKARRKSSGITGLNLDAALKEEAKKAPRCKKKIFPPGPLCSLQFLEEIENDEFDTPIVLFQTALFKPGPPICPYPRQKPSS